MTTSKRYDLISPILTELQRREDAGRPLTRAKLAESAGVTRSKVSALLGRRTGKQLVNVERLYAALGLVVVGGEPKP